MRQLALHTSALNDAEYDLYTASLADIGDNHSDPDAADDDAHYERMSIGVREARAWLRGRYSHIPASTIDAILKLFSPSLSTTDTLSGGQFFAALRLVVHVDSGKQVERSLAFVQAHPSSGGSRAASSPPPPPPPPSRRHHDTASKSVSLSLPPIVTQISPGPSASTSTTAGNNPFAGLITSPDGSSTNNQSYPQAPPQHPMLRVDPFKQTAQPSHNPFAKINSVHEPSTKSPPLPPRKPPPPAPPSSIRHAAPPISVKRSTSPTRPNPNPNPNAPPPPPPKLVSHVTSTLIKQSLHASKVAQSLKKAEEQLEKERIMQVLKSSSGGAGPGIVVRNRSISPGGATPSTSSWSGSDEWDRGGGGDAPPLPRRRGEKYARPPRMNPSPPQSTTSYDQVALAGLSQHRGETSTVPMPGDSRGRSHSHPSSSAERAHSCATTSVDSHPGSVTSSPGRMTAGLPAIPPPTHPDRRERDERERDRRVSLMSGSVHSGKSGKSPAGSSAAGRLPMLLQSSSEMQTQTQTTMDTAPFDSVYVPLVSPVNTGDEQESECTTTAGSSVYGTPTSDRRATLPAVQTALPSPITPDSPTPTRVFRSKSMYQPSTTTPPRVPPPLRRRKRPESEQVLGGGGGTLFEELVNRFEGEGNEGEGASTKLSRHLSLSSTPGGPRTLRRSSLSYSTLSAPASASTTRVEEDGEEPLTLAALQRTFANLQPRLDKVRYKAEAGISRRGFIQGGGEVDGAVGLLSETR